MMNTRLSISIALALTLATVAGEARMTLAQSIVEAKGEVQLKSGKSGFRSVSAGTLLMDGDILKTSETAKVTVLCNNATLWRVPSGIVSGVRNGCPPVAISQVRRGKDPQPGGNNATIPYVMTPGMTFVLNSVPTFRWHRVAGVNDYTVKLLGPAGVQWQTKVSATEVVYPASAPVLETDVKYLLVVEADNGTSSLQDEGGVLGFEVLDSETAKMIQAETAKIQANADLTAEAKALAIATIYGREMLTADAIDILETFLKQNNQPSNSKMVLIYSMLGDLYSKVGLNSLAEANYSKAINIFTINQDIYGLAETQSGMAVVKLMLGKKAEAEQMLNKAKENYLKLNDEEGKKKAEQLQTLLDKAEAHKKELPKNKTIQDIIESPGIIQTPRNSG